MEWIEIEENEMKGFSQAEWDRIRWNEGGIEWGLMRSNELEWKDIFGCNEMEWYGVKMIEVEWWKMV